MFLKLLFGITMLAALVPLACPQAAGGNNCSGKLPIAAIQASTDDGDVPDNAVDGNLQTRWSGYGTGANITADIGSIETVCAVGVAWYKGNQRRTFFTISASTDGSDYQQIYTGSSSGTSTDFETYTISATSARYVRLTVNGNSVNEWASIAELRLTGVISAYDETILADHPVAYLPLNPHGQTEPDLTGNGNSGTYMGGTPGVSTMPNGDRATTFNGSNQYVTVKPVPSLSIPATGNFTWEGWVDPAVLQFPRASSDGYIDWMGKCANYVPSCEWEARFYNLTNPQGRCNRLSAYVFNPTAGLGSAADWQPVCGLFQPHTWIYVVGEYTTQSEAASCANASEYPGSIDIWVNGIKWDQAAHAPTGCMSQYKVVPTAGNSPLTIGTMAFDTFFEGAIGKVAIYDYRLSPAQIANHFTAMTGKQPKGLCTNNCSF